MNQWWLTISLRPNPTYYAEIVATCKGYDKAMEEQQINSVIGEGHTVSENVVVCSYPKCGKGPYCCSVVAAQEGVGERKAEASRTEQGL